MMDLIQRGDIYYKDSYGKLYEDIEAGEYIRYEYSSVLGTVIHPFIKRPVPYLIDDRQYYDIVTPYGYGGPLIVELADNSDTGKHKIMSEFVKTFGRYCHENDIIAEFIRFHTLYGNAQYTPSSSDEHCYEEYEITYNRKTVAIDLNDMDFFTSQFDSKCRNMVRKANKLGVVIEVDTQLSTIDTFTDIYYETMEKDAADNYYFFKRAYFHQISDDLQDESLIINALYEGEIVASSLFLYTHGGFAHYHLSATKPGYYKMAANNLILKVACEELQRRGCTWLHLGGGLNSSADDKLFAFKRSFGRLEKNQKDFYIGKKVWNRKIYVRVVEKHLDDSQKRNSFFPEYRG